MPAAISRRDRHPGEPPRRALEENSDTVARLPFFNDRQDRRACPCAAGLAGPARLREKPIANQISCWLPRSRRPPATRGAAPRPEHDAGNRRRASQRRRRSGLRRHRHRPRRQPLHRIGQQRVGDALDHQDERERRQKIPHRQTVRALRRTRLTHRLARHPQRRRRGVAADAGAAPGQRVPKSH